MLHGQDQREAECLTEVVFFERISQEGDGPGQTLPTTPSRFVSWRLFERCAGPHLNLAQPITAVRVSLTACMESAARQMT